MRRDPGGTGQLQFSHPAIDPRILGALLPTWRACWDGGIGSQEGGRATCISHANLISAAVIESRRNLQPLPGETE